MRVVTLVLMATLFTVGVSNAATPVVLVKHNEQFHGYMTLPRLSEVVVTVNKVPALYWPAGRLYKTDPVLVAGLEQQRQQLLQSLARLQQLYLQDNKPELAASAEHLQKQISTWVLAEQLLLPLDPDRVRAKVELNPKLRAGQYLLQVAPRPKSLTIAGLAQNSQLPLLNAADVADYRKHIKSIAGSSSSFLYILPAGNPVILAHTGLWNSKRQDVPAGAVLFIPFEQRLLPAEFESLNRHIVELLQHRVVL